MHVDNIIIPIEHAYDAAVDEFESLRSTNRTLLQNAYENRVLPLAIERIQAVARRRGWLVDPVDVLILTAGTQPYSIMLSLAMTPARFIGFLCTPASLEHAERAYSNLRDRLGRPVPHEYATVGLADPVSVYREILRIVRGRQPQMTVVDITSGTKAMTAAASSAAMVIGAAQRYVESSPTKHGRDWQARERIHEIPHPLVEMGDLTRMEAERFFDRGAFEQAGAMFEELHRRGAPGYRYLERAKLARAYSKVESLRFAEALHGFADDDLARLLHRGDSVDPLCDQAHRIAAQRERWKALTTPDPSDENLLRFLVAYADRRANQGLFDAAALVHYRTIELCIGARLRARGIDKDGVTPDALERAGACSAATLLRRFNEAGNQHTYRLTSWPERLALAQGWTLLAALDDPLSRCVQSKQLLGQVRVRNESIFAHGRKPINERSFDGFVRLADQIRRETAQLQSWVLPRPDVEFEFVRLSD